MADPIVIAGLKDKTYELLQAIVTYKERLERTRKELAVVAATLTIMERDGVARGRAPGPRSATSSSAASSEAVQGGVGGRA